MSERDELIGMVLPILEKCFDSDWNMTYSEMVTDAILAAGYRKPRTITTAEELDGLAEGTVIRTAGHEELPPRVALKTIRFDSGISYWQIADADDFESTSDELDDFPATVLYEPTA